MYFIKRSTAQFEDRQDSVLIWDIAVRLNNILTTCHLAITKSLKNNWPKLFFRNSTLIKNFYWNLVNNLPDASSSANW